MDKTVMIALDKITPCPDNPRKIGEDAIAAVKASIAEFGFRQPIVVWGAQNEVIIGHTRLEAAKRLGLKEAPCWRADNLTLEQRIKLRIVDNKSGEFSKWSVAQLRDQLRDLDLELEVFKTAFSQADLDGLFNNKWQRSFDSIDKIEETDFEATEVITITCNDKTQFDEVFRLAVNTVKASGFQNTKVETKV